MSAIAPKKRRKLDSSPVKAPLSAFAARKALQSASLDQASRNGDHISMNPDVTLAITSKDQIEPIIGSDVLKVVELDSLSKLDSSAEDETLLSSKITNFALMESRGQSSEAISLETPVITLSNFKPDKDNIRLLSEDTIVLRLAPGERLVILGQFELSVRKGQITLMGAILSPSKVSYSVFASSTHALPVIRCSASDVNSAELRLRSNENGLRSLSSLSPLFGRLWNDHCGPLGPDYHHVLAASKSTSFQILFSSKDGPPKSFIQPLISPPLWNEMLARCSTPMEYKPRTIMVCGPKSSGKSTFVKLLVNRILSVQADNSRDTKPAKNPGVALLDIDPGQPEYCPPGQLALVHVQEPNFGPPFAHPVPGLKSNVIQAHSIGAVSPSLDSDLYMACVSDLFSQYRNLLSKVSNCPLVINTPGWVLGTGLEILVDLIAKFVPSEVIYMSKDGPPEVVDSLTEALGSPVLTLPSQASEYTTRTAAHLRTMQYMSYFHVNQTTPKGLSWDSRPLTSIPPWEIQFVSENPGILGVMCYGEQPPATLIADTLNGSLVSIVVIDDKKAIPGWDLKDNIEVDGPHVPRADKTLINLEIDNSNQELQLPLIVRSPEDIPYFNPMNAITLDPSYSHSIGIALVRGIDTERHRIQVLTPVTPTLIEQINKSGKSIVLVSGKLDTPGWAYIERLTQRMILEKSRLKIVNDAMDIQDEEGDEARPENETGEEKTAFEGFEDAPWVEKLEGSQGRGVGSRVWRVRRDLGKTDD